jgi:hypothetical protein
MPPGRGRRTRAIDRPNAAKSEFIRSPNKPVDRDGESLGEAQLRVCNPLRARRRRHAFTGPLCSFAGWDASGRCAPHQQTVDKARGKSGSLDYDVLRGWRNGPLVIRRPQPGHLAGPRLRFWHASGRRKDRWCRCGRAPRDRATELDIPRRRLVPYRPSFLESCRLTDSRVVPASHA